ncbi:DUF6662 family protein [Granulibacter bethesdensis]|uniref:DUF6662 family protein n=1 Tax=Granulibacter bethesdensis TaxID=364410 RepID=UPI0003F1FAC6|nr:DUF6662 family protein [Granulibacter bethesdensis]APG31158.1 putative secreted protein [Granulibacter bethesdensis CGDNIH4]APH60040.1 putative secreted protein [Granulibacter bethesdensis]
MFRHFLYAIIIILFLGMLSKAQAGEGLFSRVYLTDTMPKGTFEVEETVRNRSGRAFGQYNGTDFRTELEYGITDKLQVAGYFNTLLMNAKGAPDDDDPDGETGFTRHNFTVQSIAAEFIYRLFSPYETKHGWGMALYFEPELMFHDLHNGLTYDSTAEIETRLIIQKNFLDDRLIIGYNLVLEFETIKFANDPERNSELDWNNEIGMTYRFAPSWFAGIEGRNHNEYGNFQKHEHTVFWVGPVLHYGGQHVWANLGWMHQVAGNPGYNDNGTPIGESLFLRSHERDEVTLKLGLPF